MNTAGLINPRTLHWLIAASIGLALATGHAMTFPDQINITLLRLHLGFGFLGGVLALVRLAIWFVAGPPPRVFAEQAAVLEIGSKLVHGLLRLVPIVLLVSGAGMLVVSGAAPLILAGTAPDPAQLAQVPPRNLHHLAAAILLFLIVLHSGAALWHWLAGHKSPVKLTVE
ncbi:cytochrome b [Labrenzia sp. PHM005]|uniref:cytochrome b n=1 Tax=Labrenzia sp. PHM005 TaxID=2590016 RepID=UPI0011402B52|nr:cytochrome b/b6 domain-containing protein [Labrenzia sp. PHM005]QDG75567.1 hypothetical protein FJ695_06630 [Labrenzia sp. PHM005]